MKNQKTFKFNFKKINQFENFYVNSTNKIAYKGILNRSNANILLVGPKKSGKSHLADIWSKVTNPIIYNKKLMPILKCNKNVLIENINLNLNEEHIFHIINHCNLNRLKILITSEFLLNKSNINLKDLLSRLSIFTVLKINQPNDDMLINLLTKLFIDKQFIINSEDIFKYIINRSKRSYEDMFDMVEKLDTLSLEKKRQLTIPLIKEIL